LINRVEWNYLLPVPEPIRFLAEDRNWQKKFETFFVYFVTPVV